jgi:hypothetical protein
VVSHGLAGKPAGVNQILELLGRRGVCYQHIHLEIVSTFETLAEAFRIAQCGLCVRRIERRNEVLACRHDASTGDR